GLPIIPLKDFEIEEEVIKLISYQLCLKYNIVPVDNFGNSVTIATNDPQNFEMLEAVKFATGFETEVVLAKSTEIAEVLVRIEKDSDEDNKMSDIMDGLDDTIVEVVDTEEDELNEFELLQASDDKPIVKLVNSIISNAVTRRASDIHIESYDEDYIRIRYRIDGVLYEAMKRLPAKIRNSVVTRIKILAKLDITDRKRPQDGRFRMSLKGRSIDFRLSTLPTIYGERIMIRILDKKHQVFQLDKLGLDEEQVRRLRTVINMPWGMVIIAGPSGCGKTTTLYTALMDIYADDTNIMTAENPVEFDFPGVNQVNTNDAVNLTFASALRSFLRQDPDIIMVGEVRDQETGEIAIKAALTGHLVLTSLHTNDAPSVVSRLTNMGVEPFMIAAALIGAVSQRLIRQICPKCKEPTEVTPEDFLQLGLNPDKYSDVTIYKGKGCPYCADTGYYKRTAIYEVMPISKKLQTMIIDHVITTELMTQARLEGMSTLREAVVEKWLTGVTTLEEIYRQTVADPPETNPHPEDLEDTIV
ncbi:Flp pilus assembly complex ATPase component TadA, partial [Candidatus Dependentiae bacterium]|nr:Flp pilus assembly complex ATPase component TadA [Candidatus Dependentiae bacterium]